MPCFIETKPRIHSIGPYTQSMQALEGAGSLHKEKKKVMQALGVPRSFHDR